MFRCALLFALTLLLATGPASAMVEAVDFSASIVEGDDLQVLVEGFLPNSCWEFLEWSTNAYDDKLVVYISTFYDDSGGYCLPVIAPYEVAATFPALEQGTYTLRIYENRPPTLDPLILDFTVEVSSAVADGETTWDAIKALYR